MMIIVIVMINDDDYSHVMINDDDYSHSDDQ